MKKTVFILTKEGGLNNLSLCDEMEEIIRKKREDDSKLVFDMSPEFNNPEYFVSRVETQKDCYIAIVNYGDYTLGNKTQCAAFLERLRASNGRTSWEIGMDYVHESERKGIRKERR